MELRGGATVVVVVTGVMRWRGGVRGAGRCVDVRGAEVRGAGRCVEVRGAEVRGAGRCVDVRGVEVTSIVSQSFKNLPRR